MTLKTLKYTACAAVLLCICVCFCNTCFAGLENIQNHNMESPETNAQLQRTADTRGDYSVALIITVGIILACVLGLVIGLGLVYKR